MGRAEETRRARFCLWDRGELGELRVSWSPDFSSMLLATQGEVGTTGVISSGLSVEKVRLPVPDDVNLRYTNPSLSTRDAQVSKSATAMVTDFFAAISTEYITLIIC